MKIQKRLAAAILTLLLCCSSAAVVYADHPVPDLSRTGSVSAVMTYDGHAVGGGSLIFWKAGDVLEENGNYRFALTEEFAASGLSLADPKDDVVASDLADYAKEAGLSGTSVSIGEDGVVQLENLQPGLYLIAQQDSADGFEPIAPFLVSMPMYENGDYVYEVDAQPKLGTLTKFVTPSREPSGKPVSPVEKKPPIKLPQTGQLNWPVPVMTVSGMMLFFGGWMLRYGRKKSGYEA